MQLTAFMLVASLLQDTAPALTIREELRIPAEGAGYSLTLVTELTPLPGGGTAALEPRDARITVFGPDGRFQRTIARRGQGPGELESPSWLMVRGDSVMVSDMGTNRLSVFRVAGPFVGSFRLPSAGDGVFLSTRRILVLPARVVSAFERPGGRLVLAVLDADGVVKDTLVNVASAPRVLRYVRGGGMMVGPQPFDDQPLYDVSRDGRAVVVVERSVAPGGQPAVTVRRVALNGRQSFRVRVPYVPRRLSEELVDSQVAITMRSGPPVPDGSVEPRVRRNLFLPAHLPSVTAVVAGTDGTVWLRREEAGEETTRWTLLDSRGAVVGDIRLPIRARVTAATKASLWAVELDAEDLPELVRYRVGPSGR